MFITPKFVREAVADHTGRKANGIMVRIWAAAAFYLLLGFFVGFMIFGGVSLIRSAAAHPGEMAKDKCHTAANGVRHWHYRGTRKVGGTCVRAGKTVQHLPPNLYCAAPVLRLENGTYLMCFWSVPLRR